MRYGGKATILRRIRAKNLKKIENPGWQEYNGGEIRISCRRRADMEKKNEKKLATDSSPEEIIEAFMHLKGTPLPSDERILLGDIPKKMRDMYKEN